MTAPTAERISKDLQAAAIEPEVAIRLTPSPSMPNRIEMVLDKGKEGKQVVESEGVKILLLDPEIAKALGGMVIDHEQTP